MNKREAVVVVLLALLSLTLLPVRESASNGNSCPLEIQDCVCEVYRGGHDFWCPDRVNSKYRFHFVPGQLHIFCFRDNNYTQNELLLKLRDVDMGRRSLDTFVIQYCPIPEVSYSIPITYMNATKVKEMQVLGLGFQRKDELHHDQFKGLDDLKKLLIKRVSLTVIHEQAFNGLSSLKILRLISNGLKSLKSGIFKPLVNLDYLEIRELNLEALPEDIFAGQKNLTTFKLNAKSMTKLPPLLLANMTKLNALELSRLQSDPPKNLLKFNKNLKNFTLVGDKGLGDVPADFFANTSLERFEWLYTCTRRKCYISLNQTFIKNLESIKYFSLHSTHFSLHSIRQLHSDIHPDFFQHCRNLKTVRLVQVGLRTLPNQLLRDKGKLKELFLYKNNLSSIPDDAFHGLTRLEVLDLKENRLKSISRSLLRDLVRLKVLNISMNQLTTIDYYAFITLSKLEELNLKQNQIYFNDSVQPDWQSLMSLKKLDFAQNNISIQTIPELWYTSMLDLTHLNLSDNKIGKSLNVFDLNFQQQSIKIDLSKNVIENLNFSAVLKLQNPPDSNSGRKNQNKSPKGNLILKGNPLNCNCHSIPFSNFLKGFYDDKPFSKWFRVPSDNDTLCSKPKDISGLSLKVVENEDLYCNFPSPELHPEAECPNVCTCKRISVLSKTVVDCSNRNLTSLPKFIPMLMETSQTELLLSGNDLDNGIFEQMTNIANFSRVTHLDLSRNKLSVLQARSLPPDLQSLSLNGNQIKSFNQEALTLISNLTRVDLGGNAFQCDCSAKDLLNVFRRHQVLISNADEILITCNDDTRSLLRWHPHELCTNFLFIILPVIFLIVIAALILTIVCLFYKKPLSIWIYSHRTLRRLLFMEDLEDKPYDAFISYSNEDRQFVEQQLVPGLEGGKDIKYKCLVHIRDFDVGRPIMEQISDAVDNSRRTVIILSRNFVNSSWYEHEFAAAHSRKRVIVIVYGELPTKEEMGPEMWQYIKTNTYLENNDPWFWDKLRYALPHRGRKQKPTKTNDEISLIGRGSPISEIPAGLTSEGGQSNPNFISSTVSLSIDPNSASNANNSLPMSA